VNRAARPSARASCFTVTVGWVNEPAGHVGEDPLREEDIITREPMASGSETPPRAWKDRWCDELAWTGTSSPEGDAPRAIHDAIVVQGLTRFGDVAAWVAEELFGRDSAHAGFIASIGFFRSWYLVLACREIDRLSGTIIAVTRHGGADSPPRQAG
jgi:hypothetical protein